MIIDYRNNKFRIQCSFRENPLVQSMPTRRFNKRRKEWDAPAVARNIEHIQGLRGNIEITEAAQAAIDKVLAKKAKRSSESFPSWYPFKTDPFSHQVEGLNSWWGNENFALFCEMGTGKSKMALDWFSASVMNRAVDVLIIFCPTAIRNNWLGEIDVHCAIPDVKAKVIDLTTKSKKNDLGHMEFLEDDGPKIAIVGIESIQHLEKDGTLYNYLVEFTLHPSNKRYACGIDESHLIANHRTNRWKNIDSIGMNALYKFIMTGTSITNGPLSLFGQMEFLDPDILGFGEYAAFKSRYAVHGGYEDKEVIGYQNLDELVELVRPYVFQKTKEEALDLPDKVYMPPRIVEMSPEQKRVYKDLTKHGMMDLDNTGNEDDEILLDGILSIHTALQQVANGFVTYWEEPEQEGQDRKRRMRILVPPEKNPKIQELIRTIEDIGPGHKVLIWCKYRMEIENAVQALNKVYGDDSTCQYHGGLNPDERHAEKMRFQEDPKARFFVLNTSVGGTGLTMNQAKYSLYLSNSFKFVERQQSEDRNHRIGQDEKVTYINIIANCPIEKNIIEAVGLKKDLSDLIKDKIRGGVDIEQLL